MLILTFECFQEQVKCVSYFCVILFPFQQENDRKLLKLCHLYLEYLLVPFYSQIEVNGLNKYIQWDSIEHKCEKMKPMLY